LVPTTLESKTPPGPYRLEGPADVSTTSLSIDWAPQWEEQNDPMASQTVDLAHDGEPGPLTIHSNVSDQQWTLRFVTAETIEGLSWDVEEPLETGLEERTFQLRSIVEEKRLACATDETTVEFLTPEVCRSSHGGEERSVRPASATLDVETRSPGTCKLKTTVSRKGGEEPILSETHTFDVEESP
jgi:hypothetical protein